MADRKFKEIIWADDDSKKMAQLQQLGESVREGLGGHCGPMGARNIALGVLRSDRAAELADLLPWLLMRKLGNHIYEQDDIVPWAILIPGLAVNIHEVSATGLRLKNTSEGVKKPRHFRGVRLWRSEMVWRRSGVSVAGSVFRGRSRLNRLMACSTPPFCHGEYGSQK